MKSNKAPYNYSYINMFLSRFNPSALHTRDTALFNYYVRYLFQKIISVYEFRNIPDWWAENYFKYVLFGYGHIAVFDTDKYGVIPQECSLSDTHTIFYQPSDVLIANPVLGEKRLKIGKDCELVKLQPDYAGVMDIVTVYADLMAVALETANINLMNSKASFIFMAQNKAEAETYKKLYDELAGGKPFAIVSKTLMNEDGSKNWDFFIQNVGQNYITDRILNDMKTIEDQFNTKIGIPNANTQKRERLISSEVMANDIDTKALVNVWLDTMKNDLEKVNERYGLDIEVGYRYERNFEEAEQEGAEDGNEY